MNPGPSQYNTIRNTLYNLSDSGELENQQISSQPEINGTESNLSEPDGNADELTRIGSEIESDSNTLTQGDTVSLNQADFPFLIICGSFKSANNAKKLQDQLRKEGFESLVFKAENQLYRVTLGAFRNRQNAEIAFRDFKKGKYKDIWIFEVR